VYSAKILRVPSTEEISHEDPCDELRSVDEEELDNSPPQEEKTIEDKETIAIKKLFFMKTPSHFEFV
jgi:hypothetical protein